MSSNDGNNQRDDSFSTFSSNPAEFLQVLSQPVANNNGNISMPPTLMWQNQLVGPQYIQPTLPPQQPQPQLYNDYMFNMHTQNAYASPAATPETYSVLPVGHGNFLKVYHCTDNGVNGGLVNDGNVYQHAVHQAQAYHLQSPQSPPASTTQVFNSYELFSSNTVMPVHDNQSINLNAEVNIHPQSYPQQMQQSPPSLLMMNNTSIHDEQTANTNCTTNMIINKLVNNWSPNLTGGTYSQFGTPLSQLSTQSPLNNNDSLQQSNVMLDANICHGNSPHANTQVFGVIDDCNAATMPISLLHQNPEQIQPTPVLSSTQTFIDKHTLSKQNYNERINIVNANLHIPPIPSVNNQTEVKKRIVAEVKPMPLTYSDVLSKGNSSKIFHHSNQHLHKSGKSSGVANNRKSENKNSLDSNNVQHKRHGYIEDALLQNKTRRPAVYDNKENLQQQNSNSKISKRVNKSRIKTITNDINVQQKQNMQKPTQKPVATTADINKKRANSKQMNTDDATDLGKNRKTGITEKDINSYYNVSPKDDDYFEHKKKTNSISSASSTASTSSASSSSVSSNISHNSTAKNSTRKTNKSSNYYSNSHTYNSSGGNNHKARYNHSTSYSYSSKRNRGANYSSSHGSLNNGPNRNYELAKKLLTTWLEYMIKILNWLFYLVYDIIVLGFSMFYDRMLTAYDSSLIFVKQLRKDLKQNSDKPSIWIKNYWRKFDGRFEKNSNWAFWRKFYKKKPPDVPTESFKSGRLPQTGEEAMYSLLNCKGKDAYSILGVPANSSPEQIRKHYKKIAVLVHPDKNKQAGAEEAFKVLQRAFELIGEPENRLAYDQSLVEALHAEKAWTELHDLLSQLQTKITEAANTIRCSTCGLRHPRKQIDRPHYAARDCASCKIRHSAREGDIWAETSFMGLRWKYLALMEGKVYDITEWANCQKGALSHLEPNSHMVQYRIVRGAQQQQQQQQTQQQRQQQSPQNSQKYNSYSAGGSGKFNRDIPQSDTSLHDFLDNLYSGQNPNQPNSSAYASSSRKRSRRN
ncbi:putative uncharacterized protein DDB_G0282129 [Teleopsis dalmanni]|uniref:putative uncharacterized protein DDB_G0282129 n=1 Tax=Teleopsis dalmanni TaxID=139649 RepID=UPI0018CD54FF|nr:putative uncharacterized protein DDB_G0282129 [Teleopsis dalmanni]